MFSKPLPSMDQQVNSARTWANPLPGAAAWATTMTSREGEGVRLTAAAVDVTAGGQGLAGRPGEPDAHHAGDAAAGGHRGVS